MRKMYFFLFSLFIFSLCSLLNIEVFAQERMKTPDGEYVYKKIVFTGSFQYRLTATAINVYISKYTSNGNWSAGKNLFTVPIVGRRIIDMNLLQGETGNDRTVNLLLDDGSIYTFVIDFQTQSLIGTVMSYPQPTALSPNKFLSAQSKYYGLMSYRFYYNAKNGNGWVIDTTGLGGVTMYDIAFDGSQNIIGATSKGLFKLSKDSTKWSRFSNIDTLTVYSVYINRKNNNLYAGTSNKGMLVSTDNGSSWVRDTGSFGSTGVYRIADDIYGNVYFQSASSSGIYRRLTTTNVWERIDTNLRNTISTTMTISDFGGDSTLEFAGSFGIFSSADFGTTWNITTNGIQAEETYGLLFLYNGRRVTSTRLGIFTQDDTLSPWVKRYPVKGYVGSRPLRMDNNGYLYTQESVGYGLTHPPNVLRSTDGGLNWDYDTLGISNAVITAGASTTFYVDQLGAQHYGTSATSTTSPVKVFRKNPNLAWAIDTAGAGLVAPPNRTYYYFNTFGSSPDNLYFATVDVTNNVYSNGRLYKRNILSGNWALDTAGFGGAAVSALIANKSGVMFAGTQSAGKVSAVYYNLNNRWQKIEVPGAAATDVLSLGFDSTNTLFVNFTPFRTSSSNRGVYSTDDLGKTWYYAGLDSFNVRGLTALGNSMYAYTNRGIYKLIKVPLTQPKMVLSIKTIDFGKVAKGSYKDTTITVNNTGNDILRITNITSTSSAFAAQTKTLNINAGSSANVVLRFTPNDSSAVKATFRIVSNTFPDSIVATGQGTGFKYPKMVLSKKVINFGNVDIGKYKDTTVVIKNIGEDTLRITNINSNLSDFVTTPKNFIIKAGDSAVMTIRFTPSNNNTRNARLTFTGNMPVDSINVTGVGQGQTNKKPIMTLSSKTINFGPVPLQTTKDTTFTVRNTGNDTLKVVNISVNVITFKTDRTSFNLLPDSSIKIKVSFTPYNEVQQVGKVIIFSNVPTDSVTVVGLGYKPSSVDEQELLESLDMNIMPNPVENEFNVHFNLPLDCPVSIKLYDILGSEVAVLYNSFTYRGEYNLSFNANNLNNIAGGYYYCRLSSGNYSRSKIIFIHQK